MKIWMFNHYATNQYFDETGRHQGIAKYLKRRGHDVKIFCANTIHNSIETIDLGEALYFEKKGVDDVDYIFVKTSPYQGNGASRIKNMMGFWKNVKKTANILITKEAKPDVILASSVHPLTLIAGLQLKKKHNIPCICEIRDLWPESLVELNKLKRESMIAKAMYVGEKWIYKKADQVIFTMPGGSEYIRDRKWEKHVRLSKVHNINNGIDYEVFQKYKVTNIIEDKDLADVDTFKVVYAGSIREVNNVSKLVDVAAHFKEHEECDVKFLVYGDGDKRDELEKRCVIENLDNIVFKGRVEKKYIPYITSKADLNIVTGMDSNIARYGVSWNKLFEYMAAEVPVIADYDLGKYDLIKEYDLGIAQKFKAASEMADQIMKYKDMDLKHMKEFQERASAAAVKYDYDTLAEDLLNVIDKIQ